MVYSFFRLIIIDIHIIWKIFKRAKLLLFHQYVKWNAFILPWRYYILPKHCDYFESKKKHLIWIGVYLDGSE